MSPGPSRGGGLSRRQFIRNGGLYGGGLWLTLHLPRPLAARAAAESAKPEVLSPAEWRTVEAITARIIPTDAEPGAREAHCVNFIDKALAHEDAEARPVYQLGVAGVEAVAKRRHDKPFAGLEEAQQDALLAALQAGSADGWPDGPVSSPLFFETVRAHTIIAFLAEPRYGGNRDYVGWRVTRYPGPRHRLGGYSPEQMSGAAKIPTVWGEEI